MSTWVVDHASTLYILLALLGIILVGAWWLTRNTPRRGGAPASGRPYLAGVAAVVALLGIVWLVDHFTQTDSKQIEQALESMSAGVSNRNVDQIFQHISEQFRWHNGDRAHFRPIVERHLGNGDVTEVKIWDIDVREIARDKRTATVTFKVKSRGNAIPEPGIFNCRSGFRLDNDGQWRLQTFELFQPQTAPMRGEPIQVPGG